MTLTEEEISILGELVDYIRGRQDSITGVPQKTKVIADLRERARKENGSSPATDTPTTRIVAIERRIGEIVTRTEYA